MKLSGFRAKIRFYGARPAVKSKSWNAPANPSVIPNTSTR
ncbi:hypothetical protein Hhel01_00739 [Haloferula helveola]